jgi:hypothetical protein
MGETIMSEVKDQIDEMLKMYDVQVEEPEEEIKDNTNSVEELEEESEEIIEEETKVSDNTESISIEKPEVKTEDEFEKLRREHEEFKLKLDEILNRKPEEKPNPVIEPTQITEQDFLEGEDLDDIISDSKSFNKLLNKVFLKGIELANKKNEELKNTLPETIRNNVVDIENIRKASDKFYKDNSDLSSFKGAVATVYSEIASIHPEWGIDKLLKEVEVETRKRLNLDKPEKTNLSEKKDVPSLPRKKSQTRKISTEHSVDPLVSDIDAMNAVLYK